jgi:hypothetical protein
VMSPMTRMPSNKMVPTLATSLLPRLEGGGGDIASHEGAARRRGRFSGVHSPYGGFPEFTGQNPAASEAESSPAAGGRRGALEGGDPDADAGPRLLDARVTLDGRADDVLCLRFIAAQHRNGIQPVARICRPRDERNQTSRRPGGIRGTVAKNAPRI